MTTHRMLARGPRVGSRSDLPASASGVACRG